MCQGLVFTLLKITIGIIWNLLGYKHKENNGSDQIIQNSKF